jgi:hypothetical protein
MNIISGNSKHRVNTNYINNISININDFFLFSIDSIIHIPCRITIKLQLGKLYFFLNINDRSYIQLNIFISNNTKFINYTSDYKLNKNTVCLNFCYIYIIIKKYYLNKIKYYWFDIYAKKERYKQINTMRLNKNIALII